MPSLLVMSLAVHVPDKSALSPTCAKDYSYLKAIIGSTRMARRAGM